MALSAYSISEQSQAAKSQKASVDIQRQQADLQAARQRRDVVRQSRIAQANAQQSAENQGVASSSSAIGGQESIVSQTTSNLSFLDKYNAFTDAAQTAMGKVILHTSHAQSAQAVVGLEDKVASYFTGGSGG